MADEIAIVLSPDATRILEPTLKLLKRVEWTVESMPGVSCVVCQEVDFSGYLVKADILAAKEGDPALAVWFPNSYVLLAFDFSVDRSIGFLPASA